MKIKGEDEYILEKVSPILLSDESITPNNFPRVTQPSYGIYLTRLDGKYGNRDRDIKVHPKILDMWTERQNYLWVDKPGVNDYYLNEMVKTYSINYNFHPRSKPKKKFIPRSNIFELDCIEQTRLEGMKDIGDDKNYSCQDVSKIVDHKKVDCEFSPPFWWKKNEENNMEKRIKCVEIDKETKQYKSWKPSADMLDIKSMSCCEKRIVMNQVGQPFQHEGCIFYYEKYPPPNIPFRKDM